MKRILIRTFRHVLTHFHYGDIEVRVVKKSSVPRWLARSKSSYYDLEFSKRVGFQKWKNVGVIEQTDVESFKALFKRVEKYLHELE